MRNPRIVVLDETPDLSRQVEHVTSALRPRVEVTWCNGFGAVDDALAEGGPFDVLVAGPVSATPTGLQQLRSLRGRLPHTTLILAFDQWRRGSLRDTVRAGAMDLLRLPVTDEALLEAVEQALELRRAAPVPAGEDPAPGDGEGKVMAVVSATGGCGKTFFATNLAYHLQSQHRKRTCLLDLDLQFGELSTALRLKPRHTITDVLASGDGDDDDLGRRLEEHLEHHESGVYVLAAPDEPAAADGIEAADVARVIEAARSRFDYVIIDTPAALSESVLVGIEHAEQIFALATLDLPSVRNLGVMLTTFKQLKVPAERVKLLLNKVEPDVGIDVARVEKYFPQGFSMVIPYGREVNRSLNMGLPVLAYAPRGEVSKALTAGLSGSLVVSGGRAVGTGDAGDDAGPAPTRRRRLGWRQKRSA